MSSPLLILAQAGVNAVEAASAHGETDTITRITQNFGISVPFIAAQIVNFAIVATILWYFAFRPVVANLDARQKKIASGIQYADEMKAQLAAAQQAVDAQLREAQLKVQAVMAEAQRVAKEFADKQQQEAIEKANGLLTKAQQAIELEKKKMLAEARTEIARLVVVTTQRVLAQELSEAERSRFADAAARELTNV